MIRYIKHSPLYDNTTIRHTMGLKWSKPIMSKNGQWIITSASMPGKDEPYKDELWNLWKQRKEDIKSDGFSLKKDGYYGCWKVTFFHKVDAQSKQKPVDGGGKMNWRIDYDAKVAKWKTVVERMKEAAEAGASNGGNDLPKDNRRVVARRNRENPAEAGFGDGGDWSETDDELTVSPAMSATSVTAEQIAEQLDDLELE